VKIVNNFAYHEPSDVKPEILQYLKIIPRVSRGHLLSAFSPVSAEVVSKILKEMVEEGLLENDVGKRGLRNSTRYRLASHQSLS